MKQMVYGKHVVKQLIQDEKKIYNAYVLDGLKDKELITLLKEEGIQITNCGKKKLDTLSENGNHQGIVVEIDAYKTYTLDEVQALKPKGEYPLYLMLDGITDPHNLGAILRTADAVGVDALIIGKHGSVGLTPTVAKVSTGAIDSIPVAVVTNLSKALQQLKKDNFWVVGTALDDRAQDYREVKYDMPLVVVVGNEGNGISPLVLKNCDFTVILPMVGSVSSLNASVATAVMLYEVHNQRHPIN